MTADPTTTLAAHPSVYDSASKVLFCCNPDCVAQGLRFERPIDHAAHQLAVLAQEGWAVVRADVVETVAELDALPKGTVVRLAQGSVTALGPNGTLPSAPGSTAWVGGKSLPAQVLYRPASGVVL